MPWTSGFGTIIPGESQRWWYSFGGQDQGPQLATGHPLNPGGTLQVNDQTKARNSDGSITYWVTVRNIGGFTTNFNLQGGGLT
jgi:hypothetical protein